MADIGRSLQSNTFVYTTALTIQKLLSFVYFTLLARSVGVTNTGQYFFALSMAGVLIAFVDIGVTPVLTREGAGDKDRAQQSLTAALLIKIIVSTIVVCILGLSLPVLIHDPLTLQLLVLSIVIALLDSFAMTFFAAIRSQHNLAYESSASILFQVIVLIFGGIALWFHADIRVIISALLLASSVNCLYAFLVAHRVYHFNLAWASPVALGVMLRAAFPFAIATIFAKIYAYFDTIVLRSFSGIAAVGIYSVAYKITFAFQFLPMAFVASLYPLFSDTWAHDRSNLSKTFTHATRYMLLISLPISAGIAALAPSLIPSLYTEAYSKTVPALIILILSLPFLFMNFPIGSLLNACRRQNRQTIHLGITMVLNVVLNVILIPRYGPLGAAIASTTSTIFIFALGWYVVGSLIDIKRALRESRIVRLVSSAAVLYIAATLIVRHSHWLIALIVSALVYGILVLMTRAITLTDLRSLMRTVRR